MTMTTKTETVHVPTDVHAAGSIIAAGTYRVEMPEYYDPALVTGEDILCDHALTVADGDTAPRTLDELLALLRSDADLGDASDLPTFGGDEPANTQGVWSWDETRLLVGTCSDDYRIVER